MVTGRTTNGIIPNKPVSVEACGIGVVVGTPGPLMFLCPLLPITIYFNLKASVSVCGSYVSITSIPLVAGVG